LMSGMLFNCSDYLKNKILEINNNIKDEAFQ